MVLWGGQRGTGEVDFTVLPSWFFSILPVPSGTQSFCFTFLPTCFVYRLPVPSGTPFLDCQKGGKEQPRRRKLRILRFRLGPKSSVAPLLLLSPPNPLRWALAGTLEAALWKPAFSCGLHFDVLCANRLATVQLTQLSRLRRSAYPLASAYCGAKVTVLPTIFHSSAPQGHFFRRCWASPSGRSTHESVEAVRLRTPRTGLNRVNCITANS